MEQALSKYLNEFRKLRVDRSHGGVAPHKPILLISVLQAYQQGVLKDRFIPVLPELVALFQSNWNILVNTPFECRFALPFYHLSSSSFWKLLPKPGYEQFLRSRSSMSSFKSLESVIEAAFINEDLLALFMHTETNIALQQILLDTYFPDTKWSYAPAIADYEGVLSGLEQKILHESPEAYKHEIMVLIAQKNEEEIFLRGSVFKREIPKLYQSSCCISHMRIDTVSNISMIDACHIVPFSESYDDTISNGIALCPNLHRAFDRGLISIDDNYKVLVKSAFKENLDSSYLIRHFQGAQILLPALASNYPSLENLAKHRNRFGF